MFSESSGRIALAQAFVTFCAEAKDYGYCLPDPEELARLLSSGCKPVGLNEGASMFKTIELVLAKNPALLPE